MGMQRSQIIIPVLSITLNLTFTVTNKYNLHKSTLINLVYIYKVVQGHLVNLEQSCVVNKALEYGY